MPLAILKLLRSNMNATGYIIAVMRPKKNISVGSPCDAPAPIPIADSWRGLTSQTQEAVGRAAIALCLAQMAINEGDSPAEHYQAAYTAALDELEVLIRKHVLPTPTAAPGPIDRQALAR